MPAAVSLLGCHLPDRQTPRRPRPDGIIEPLHVEAPQAGQTRDQSLHVEVVEWHHHTSFSVAVDDERSAHRLEWATVGKHDIHLGDLVPMDLLRATVGKFPTHSQCACLDCQGRGGSPSAPGCGFGDGWRSDRGAEER